MKKINLYGHGGSKNHGCEAIVRSTVKVLKDQFDITLYSSKKYEDEIFGLEKVCKVVQSTNYFQAAKRSKNSILFHLYNSILRQPQKAYYYYNKPLFDAAKSKEIFASIGGDIYCYDSWVTMKNYNDVLINNGANIVLWGCSIDPDDLHRNVAMQEDLKRYKLITARETYSYKAIKQYNPNTVLTCDTAFLLDLEEINLPENFIANQTVGINISPLIQNLENGNNIVFRNYSVLIEWILANTKEMVALIPHVVWEDVNDRVPIEQLYDKYKHTGRVIYINQDYNCEQLKYIISKCSCFVGARTHATIAAYSTYVPTLVSSYSIKARGIAKDLFGTEDGYVVSVQKMKEEDELTNAFINIYYKRAEISDYLRQILPEYTKKIAICKRKLADVI